MPRRSYIKSCSLNLVRNVKHLELKTWATMIKADLEPLSGPRVLGYARWRKDWVKAPSELAQDRGAWGASIFDVVNSNRNSDTSANK